MNMSQPDPAGLFEPLQPKQQSVASNSSVISQLQSRPAPANSLPTVNVAPPPSDQPVVDPQPASNNPIVALSRSGQLQALLKAKAEQLVNRPAPANPIVALSKNGGIRQLLIAKEDQQYQQALDEWEQPAKIVPLAGTGYLTKQSKGSKPVPPARDFNQIEQDWSRGVQVIRPAEFANILNLLETGKLSPEQEAQITQHIEPVLNDEGRQYLQTSRRTRDKYLTIQADYDAQMASQAALREKAKTGSALDWEAARQTTTAGQAEQFRGAVRGVSFDYAFAPDEDRLNSDNPEVVAEERAKRHFYLNEQSEYPISSMVGNMIGATGTFIPAIGAYRYGKMARALRPGPPSQATASLIARGGAPATNAGLIAEGTGYGLGSGFARRPQGAEEMTVQENLSARVEQAGTEAALSALGDVALTKGVQLAMRPFAWTGNKVSGAVNSVVKHYEKQGLDTSARDLGYQDFDEFADAATEIITDETGSRIRLKSEVFNELSDEDRIKAGGLLNRINPEDASRSGVVSDSVVSSSRAAEDIVDETQLPVLKSDSEQGNAFIPTLSTATEAAEATVQGAERSATGQAEAVAPGGSKPAVADRFKELPVIETPLSELSLSQDVPQFKSGASETGVVEPLTGTFDRRGVGAIQVWVRSDGRKEVISGRHRLDLAQRSGEQTIPAQYYYESEGFTKEDAAILDALLNIRDEKGKVKDYVDYIQGTRLTEEEAIAEGILGRAMGQRAYTIATEGSETLITAHRNDRLTDEGAARIAHAAPGNERLQSVGIKAIEDGKPIVVAENMVKAVRSMSGDTSPSGSMDMFGFDDSAIKEAELLARQAGRKQDDIQKTLSAVKGASKNPTLAAKEGVDIHDPDALKLRIAELEAQKEAWRNWHTNPDMVDELRADLGLPPTVRNAEPEPDLVVNTPEPVPENQGGFFDEFDLTQPTARELEARDVARQEAVTRGQQEQAALDARAKADAELDDFELGIQGSGQDVSAQQSDLLAANGQTGGEQHSARADLKSGDETGGDVGSLQEAVPAGTQLFDVTSGFAMAARKVSDILHLNPGGAVGGAVYGGIAGGDATEERYTPQWWLNSVMGAFGGAMVGSYGLTKAKTARVGGKTLLGDQSWAMQSMDFLGDKISKIPGFGSGDKDIKPLKKQQQLLKALLERQAEKAGQYLLDNFTPSQRAFMADLIEQRGIIAEGNLLHRQAQELDEFISFTSDKMKELGMLDESIETGAYLHRYYAKDLGITGLMRGLMPGGRTMSGSWSRRRGTQEVFDRRYMSQSMRDTLDEVQNLIVERDKLKKKAGDLIGDDTQNRIDEINTQLKSLQSIEFREYLAMENGQMKSFFLHPDEVPIFPGLKPVHKTLPGSPGVQGIHQPGQQGSLQGMDPLRLTNADQMALTDRRWTIDGKQGEEGGLLHRDWTKQERQSWGEIEDAAYRMVRGQAEVAHDLSLGIFYKQVVDRFQGTKVSDSAVEGWHQVPNTKIGTNSRLKKYGALAGKFVTPEVWAAVKHHGRNPLLNLTNNHPAVKNYLNLLGKWKAYKTVYNPVSHMNNVVSNLGMYYMSDYSPKYLAAAIKELYQGENSALFREARDNGLFGTDYTATLNVETGQRKLDELLEKLRTQDEIPDLNETLDTLMSIKQWFIESKNAVKDAQGPWQTGLELASAVGNPFVNTLKKPISKAADAMQSAYRFEDEFYKMAVYMAERQKGTKPFDAVSAANKYFFDYSDMPTFFQAVRDSPWGSPFISYTYYALPALARTAIEKPEKLFAFAAFLEGVNYAGMAINGELQDQGYWDRMAQDEEVLPDWMQGRSLFGGLNNISVPFVDSYKLGLANMLPAGNPFIGNAEREGAWPAALSFWGPDPAGSNPVMRLIFDLANNKDWRGSPIYNADSPDAAEKWRKGLNYVYQNFTPGNPLFPGSYSQQKIIEGAANEVRQAEQSGEEPNALLSTIVDAANATAETLGAGQFTGLDRRDNEILFRDALLGSLGVKLRPVRIDQFAESKMSDLNQKRQGQIKWIARHKKDFIEGRITKDQFEKYLGQFEARNQEYEQKAGKIKAAI